MRHWGGERRAGGGGGPGGRVKPGGGGFHLGGAISGGGGWVGVGGVGVGRWGTPFRGEGGGIAKQGEGLVLLARVARRPAGIAGPLGNVNRGRGGAGSIKKKKSQKREGCEGGIGGGNTGGIRFGGHGGGGGAGGGALPGGGGGGWGGGKGGGRAKSGFFGVGGAPFIFTGAHRAQKPGAIIHHPGSRDLPGDAGQSFPSGGRG